MLATLLESRARSPRQRVAMVASIFGHVVLLSVLVLARADGKPSPLPPTWCTSRRRLPRRTAPSLTRCASAWPGFGSSRRAPKAKSYDSS